MIESIRISNFKCFAELELKFKSLTLLAGTNSAGKSSALQPLLLLSQGLRQTPNLRSLPLNGTLVRLGSASDVVKTSSSSPEVGFEVRFAADRRLSWEFNALPSHRFLYRLNASGDQQQPVPGEWENILDSHLREVIYVSAVRLGPQTAYPVIDAYDAQGDVGADGRFAAYWYNQKVDDEVDVSRCHPSESANSFRKQIDAWLGSLFPGAQANVQAISNISMFRVEFRMSNIGEWQQPANVGYGLSYAFPILVALLAANDGQILVIDSPEAHLHPYAQSQMGKLLAHFASAGVQVIVETHSDHLLNGVRLAARTRSLPFKDISILFFRKLNEEAEVVSIKMDDHGRLDNWPDGFFDQIERDLAEL